MTKKQKVQLCEKWKIWIGEICEQVTHLLVIQHVWQETGKIIRDNPKIQVPSLFYDWITANYTVQIGAIIRRLAESKKEWKGQYKDTVSLWRLLDDIRQHPEVISKDYFFKRYNGSLLKQTDVPQREFDKFAESGTAFISADKIKKDIEDLDRKIAKIKPYVNKRIAHWDINNPKCQIPTYEEADRIIEFLQELTLKYRSLIPNNFFVGLPTFTYDWKQPLRYAWIEDEQKQ